MAKVIPLHGTKSGIISITKIEEPYGAGSATVVSVGVSLSGDEMTPDWKVHIPLENLEDVIKALTEVK
ncbi:MAG: hypothetical protein PHI89_06895 [Thiovulaceae bacterium]|jgi:hypothetical protein|nr:hypothetical protein [Sulfurimonadaceae bacterium]MDD3817794.1 hypothetical protein [Sulfurimonadaceae bacterium]